MAGFPVTRDELDDEVAARAAAITAEATTRASADTALGGRLTTVERGGVAKPWVTGTAYVVGQLVTAAGQTWTATDAHTSGATFAGDQAGHWVLLPLAGSGSTDAVKAWAAATAYVADQVVSRSGALWRAIANHTSGSTFDPALWTMVSPSALPATDAATPLRSLTADQSLARLAITAAADQVASAARQRMDYDDATEISEAWPDLAAWVNGNIAASSNQVVAQAGANSAGFAGAARSFVIPTAQSARAKAIVQLVATGGSGSPTGSVRIGFASNTAGALPADYTTFYGVGFTEGNIPTFWLGTTALAGDSATAGAWPAGTYYVSAWLDDKHLMMHVTNAARTHEAFRTFFRPGGGSSPIGAVNNLVVINSDSRAASGHKVGALIAKTSGASMRARGTVEGNAAVTNYAVSAGIAATLRHQLPPNWDSRRPTPVFMICHGVGDTQFSPFTDANQKTLIEALSAAGFLVASSAMAGINWGAQAAVDEVLLNYRYLRDKYAVGPLVLCGISMGAMASLNAIAQRRVPVAGWAGIYPAIDLAEAYSSIAFDLQVNNAYGITTARLTSSAAQNASTIVASYPYPNGSVIQIGTGGNAETRTTTGTPTGGAGPWTVTLTAPLSNAHAANEVVAPTTGATTYATRTLGHDPALMTADRFRGLPMRFYASPSDTVIPKATNTDVFKARIEPYAPESTVQVCTGTHGDASHFQPADLVAFAQRCVVTT